MLQVFKRVLVILCLVWFSCIFLTLTQCEAKTPPPIIVVSVKGEINDGQAILLHRAVEEAKAKSAKAVIVELDTFGGLVDSAVKIRDMIVDSPMQTICYIKNRAWSAGALIAIAHHNIVIAPGGSIGAAEPIPATEKTIAALKAEFAATANKRGRNVQVAEAMVDKSLGFAGFAEKGKILALADYQAIELGYADSVAQSRTDVLNKYNLSDSDVIEIVPTSMDSFVGWLSDPNIKSILLTIIFLAVLTEIKTAGMGAGAAIGLVAAILFFGSQWFVGVAGWLNILLFIGGLLLLVIELYVPGVGIFGITGTGCIMFSLFLTLGGNLDAISTMALSLVVAVVLFLILLKYLPSSKLWSTLVLKEAETTQAGYISGIDYTSYLDRTGITVTPLRPAGMVNIDGSQLNVVSEGQFINKGIEVKVVNIDGVRIIVRPTVNKKYN